MAVRNADDALARPTLPDPVDGDPSQSLPDDVGVHDHWVPTVPSDDKEVVKALSGVPAEKEISFLLGDAQYLPVDEMYELASDRNALTRMQVELVAARTSKLNDCFYRTTGHSMLLSLSGLNQDAQISFDVVVGTGDGDGGVPNGHLLASLAEAMWDGDPHALAAVRDEVTEVMGGDALVDAVAVSANFHMMTRIADGTGTPLDKGGIERTADVRAQIGVDDMISRRQTDPE